MIGLELSPASTGHTAPDPLAAFFAKGSGAHVALGPGPQGGLSIWTEQAPPPPPACGWTGPMPARACHGAKR
ncbi:MAG: hypothetical protein ACMUJK_02520 [Rhodobacterales bacterium]